MPRKVTPEEVTAQARAMREVEASPDCPKTLGAYWAVVAEMVGITPAMAATRARANGLRPAVGLAKSKPPANDAQKLWAHRLRY